MSDVKKPRVDGNELWPYAKLVAAVLEGRRLNANDRQEWDAVRNRLKYAIQHVQLPAKGDLNNVGDTKVRVQDFVDWAKSTYPDWQRDFAISFDVAVDEQLNASDSAGPRLLPGDRDRAHSDISRLHDDNDALRKENDILRAMLEPLRQIERQFKTWREKVVEGGRKGGKGPTGR